MKKQSGNILIYILGAIFLIGLLTVISRGSVTPGAGIDPEQLMIRVSEVQEYGRELEQAVAYIMANGHSESDIRFAHPDASSAYGDITDTPSRQIFARDGGGARYRKPPEGIQTTSTPWIFNGTNRLLGIGTDSGSHSSIELIALLMNVNKQFCLSINKNNNIDNVSGNPPQDNGSMDNAIFTGTFTNVRTIADDATMPSYLYGKMEGCFEGDTDPPAGTYHYYRVLLAR